MLKALELVGFKSFADKTRFEFPPGITVVVGPNGSGKSNIVDAIKWVLGEQSAKSLRGKDMSDVIFKGSGQGGRKVMNTAEATIVFDNSDGRLAIDAPEVHVTRRVYRSGEGEYLINRQACRLKDVRDLFRGTGVGTDAYSLIEQGKVDRLLQASPRDRRAIFEEAAGISRFKAKKIEAQRRLERVDQNLLRLSDIVDEVGNRLRSVRSQAAKARRYREYSDRLKQLRTQVALTQWRKLTEKLDESEAELRRMGDQVGRLTAELTAADARVLELETDIVSAVETIREREHRLARNREQIAGRESAIEHERQHIHDLDAESVRHRSQCAELTGRAGDVTQRLDQTRTVLDSAQADYENVSRRLAELDQSVSQRTAQLDACRRQIDGCRSRYLEGLRRSSQLANEITRHKTQRATAEATIARCVRRGDKIDAQRRQKAGQLERARSEEDRLTQELARIADETEQAERELDANNRLFSRRRDELAVQQGRLSGISQRAALLEDLERRNEGLTAGVQQVLARAGRDDQGPFAGVLGLVADVIEVPMQWAPLIDAALGPAAQHIVLRDTALLDALQAGTYRLAGRVGFVSLASVAAASASGHRELESCEGVLGRLDQLVRAAPEMMPVVRRLLGNTWAVEMLSHARTLHAEGIGDLRLVTLAGEVLNPDGTLVAGPKDMAGLISRRTELRDLRREETVLNEQIIEADQEILRLRENIDRQQVGVWRLVERQKRQNAELADQQVKARTLQNQLAQLETEHESLVAERTAAQKELDALRAQRDDAETRLADLERELAELEAAMHADQQRMEEDQAELRAWQTRATEIRVERAKSEERLDGLRLQLSQFEDDRRERSEALADAEAQRASAARRRQAALGAILDATSEVALLYLRKERLEQQIAEKMDAQGKLQTQRAEFTDLLKAKQTELSRVREKLHQCELAAGEVRHDRSTLADRLREDYGIEIAALEEEQGEEDQQQRIASEEEIASLRRKISNIGAVNMEALHELDDLETRFESLNGQYQDLTQARESLERIIHKINADSRRLFSETLEAIRINFQSLYRKAFGGGKADIVLEEGVDILECGVDIVATPPGKPSFDNSLLSGGEKALTAVALLLAIFQYRPSPFCVLDEVDAPFDEANIGRFVDVLKEFLGWTKFVLVTHSKKTMTAATTIYGVTMQESGVSKQVSVRFEDVSDEGEISPEALQRTENREPDDGERGAA